MKRLRVSILIKVLPLLFISVNAFADENWSGVTKSPGDYTSSGIVTITGATTLQAGTYTFTTLNVNSTLTLNGDTGTTNGSGVIINATTVMVGSGGSINADGKGFAGNAGPGKGAVTMGGCHGGFGGYGSDLGAFCTPYATSLQPTTLGSGGGAGGSNTPGAGGGAIQLVVSGTLTVTGNISANGGNASGTSGATKAGGGAGGSIWIDAGTLAGTGPIRANGGAGINTYSGGGGGGAVAVYYGTKTHSGTISANGGTSTGIYAGYPGSVLIIDSVNNDLYVNSVCQVANGTYAFRNITVSSGAGLTVQGLGSKGNNGSGKGVCVSTDCSGGSYGGRGGLGGSGTSLVNAGMPYGSTVEPVDVGSGGGVSGTYAFGGEAGGAIKLIATGTLTNDGLIDADGMPASVSGGTAKPGGGSGGSVWVVAGSVAGNGTFQAIGGTGVGGAGGGGRIAIHYSGTLSTSFTYNVAVGGGTTTIATVGSVAVVDTANNNLYFPVTSTITSGTYTYNNLTVAPSVKISALDGGNAGAGDSPGANSSSLAGGGGGGHGGVGGNGGGSSTAAGGGTIGSATEPDTKGSGGGSNTSGRGVGGCGGGALRLIVSNSITIGAGGNLNADGGSFGGSYGGGGSGGSIWITAKNINSVTNGITAKGGNGDSSNYGGAGGGGRIAIYCTGSYSGTVSVVKGGGVGSAGNGTSTIKCTSPVWFFRGY